MLTHTSAIFSTPFNTQGRTLWTLSESGLVPAECEHAATAADWEQLKMGHVGEHLRVVNQGMWQPSNSTAGGGCGVEIMAVSPPTVYNATGHRSVNTSVLLKVTAYVTQSSSSSEARAANQSNTTYIRIAVADDGAGAIEVAALGMDGALFYAALKAQHSRWQGFTDAGAKAAVPEVDRRYTATSNALMTMFMNNDRGMVPIYGSGQFWNTYNIYLPLDTYVVGAHNCCVCPLFIFFGLVLVLVFDVLLLFFKNIVLSFFSLLFLFGFDLVWFTSFCFIHQFSLFGVVSCV